MCREELSHDSPCAPDFARSSEDFSIGTLQHAMAYIPESLGNVQAGWFPINSTISRSAPPWKTPSATLT